MKQHGTGKNCKDLKWHEYQEGNNPRDEAEAVSEGKHEGLVGNLKSSDFILRASGSHGRVLDRRL